MKKCSKNIFLFNEEVFEQIDGLSMGSPLAPILANWFVAKVESTVLGNSNVKQPKFYRRYVDDVFAVFESAADRDQFFDCLNGAHENLQFTMENIDNVSNSLPFLDVSVRVADAGRFETSVYRKPTNTNVVLNYEAVAPTKWKRAIIKCFLTRARRVTSSKYLFEKEVRYIKTMLKTNGYPTTFVENTIDDYMNSASNDGKYTEVTKDSIPDDADALKPVYFVVPYVGKASEKLQRRVGQEMREHGIHLRAANKTTKVGSYFSLKTNIPKLFKTDVVYQFRCPEDQDCHYIGETQRQFYKRIMDHLPGTTKQPTNSAIHEHVSQCNGCMAQSNATLTNCFSIIRTCNTMDVLSEEAICIKKYEPSLNTQMGAFKGSRVPTNIFN